MPNQSICDVSHILPESGALRLKEITRERIKDFVAHLVWKRFIKRVKVKVYRVLQGFEFRSSTGNRLKRRLCSVFSHAVEEKVIDTNLVMKLGKFYKATKSVHEEIQPLSAEEVPAFLVAVLDRSFSREYYPVFCV